MESLPAKSLSLMLLFAVVVMTSSLVSGEDEVDAAVAKSLPSLDAATHLLPPLHAPASPPHAGGHNHHLLPPLHGPASAPYAGGHHHHRRPKPGVAPSPHVKPLPHPPHPPAVAPAPVSYHRPRPHHPKPSPPSSAVPPSHVPPPTNHAPPPVPVHPRPHPISPPRSFIAAQGVVYCKPCKYAGVNTLLHAVPLLGAKAELRCNNSRYKPAEASAVTDVNGYFRIDAPETVTSYAVHRCLAFLVSVPSTSGCANVTDLNAGRHGARLIRLAKAKPTDRLLYSVGPFAAEPATCPR